LYQVFVATIRQIVSRSDMTRVDMSRPLRGRGTQSSTGSAWCLVLEAWRLGGGGCGQVKADLRLLRRPQLDPGSN